MQGLLCGIGGGLVGACIWATIAHFTGTSADYAAWIVGICVGVGVAFGAQPKLNFLTGSLAAVLAAGCVIISSFGAAEFSTGQKVETARTNAQSASTAEAIGALREDIEREWHAKAATVVKSDEAPAAGADAGGAATAAVEPPSIAEFQQQAAHRWAGMGVTERKLYRAKWAERQSVEAGKIDVPFEFRGYFARMTPLQMVWFGLAVATAFKVGATPGRRLDEMEQDVANAAARNNPILRGAPSAGQSQAFSFGGAPGGGTGTGPSTAPSPRVAPAARTKAA